ncbi:MAG: ankyrin repeat domain-containing protein [Bacteroidota bacterium]
MSGGDWKEMLYAAENGNLELVKYHVKMGVDVNYQHPELLTTALIESTRYGHEEVVKYLLEKGADPKIKAVVSSSGCW